MYLGLQTFQTSAVFWNAPDGATKLARTAKSHQGNPRCNTFGARFVTEIGRPAVCLGAGRFGSISLHFTAKFWLGTILE